MAKLNDTHNPALKSWVASANRPDTDFPIQNLPLGVFRTKGGAARGGIAIGDQILDLAAAAQAGLFSGAAADAAKAASGATLNALMAMGNGAASALRARVSQILADGSADKAKAEKALVAMADAEMLLPAIVGAFSDYLCSYDHTLRMSQNRTLPPAFKAMPLAYNSRASSLRVSGEEVIRPNGQFRGKDGKFEFGPEPMQDFELELGLYVGKGNELGAPIPMEHVTDHMFGYCLLNDWSARGIQGMEMAPLGPFLGKSLSTTVSSWIVTAEALAPFRIPARERPAEDQPHKYLLGAEDQKEGGFDLQLYAYIQTPKMQKAGRAPHQVTRAEFKHIYWTMAQMTVYHASNGCNLRPGDIIASGTVSGPTDDSRACLAEATVRGTLPLELPDGEKRAWIEDGDEVIFRGRAETSGYVSIGFGECRNVLKPAVPWPGAH
jgi:fumarylacetoacetase